MAVFSMKMGQSPIIAGQMTGIIITHIMTKTMIMRVTIPKSTSMARNVAAGTTMLYLKSL